MSLLERPDVVEAMDRSSLSPLSYLSLQALVDQGHGLVRFGSAPDGLPHLMRVPEPAGADGLLMAAAQAMGAQLTQTHLVGTPLEEVSRALSAVLHDQYRTLVPLPEGGEARVMILPKVVRSMLGATLMARVLPGEVHTPGAPPQSHGRASYETSRQEHTGAVNFNLEAAARVAEVARLQEGEACLAMRLDTQSPVVVQRTRDAQGWPEYTFKHTYAEESCATFEGSSFRWSPTYTRLNLETQWLAPDDWSAYAQLRLLGGYWTWVLPRTSVARVLARLARALGAMHDEGQIHGDVKPANVLVVVDGVVPFDGLGLKPGDRALAMTKGWAAPEQVLGQPLQPQADQYPLGMMLLKLVEGVMYGVETRISVPIGGKRLGHHVLLRDPGVFIDPNASAVAPAAVNAWRGLIERCVRFEPERRFDTAHALADAIDQLADSGGLQGNIEVALNFGSLHRVHGHRAACWLV